ncbi:dienelactone hydrolase family protein [Kribbella albertanoniae]|uniref:Dienelactone hydrolase n=1 Tax=Kribbella albertanoniae TaxID=1266829 RepID=A0A4R4NZ85_9ACTN|nr:dienelactone hydrolase family protein [Kribbella albertanoniae]TDC15241.1 dienelactone hydrolase [Kribbella albertanoniae]
MTEVVLYHHSQGLTDGVKAFAEELRQAGHTVHTPDLYDGNTFDTIEDGMAYGKSIGFGKLLEAGVAYAQDLPSGVVYAGFSMGVMPAQQLTQTRAGARGGLFYHSCLPVGEFSETWPAGVPVQIHGMDEDPWFTEEDGDLASAQALVAANPADAELFLYPGKSHLFADSSLADHDQEAAILLIQRTLTFLTNLP